MRIRIISLLNDERLLSGSLFCGLNKGYPIMGILFIQVFYNFQNMNGLFVAELLYFSYDF